MKHFQSVMALVAAAGLAVIAAGCAQEGQEPTALSSVTGPTAIVQNTGVTQGCSPGYWKNHSFPAGYSPNQTLESVFDIPDSLGLDNVTLLTALQTGGGGVDALLRQGVAALLNSALGGYPLPTFYVIQAVNNSLASGDPALIESIKDQLDVWNNSGIPGFC